MEIRRWLVLLVVAHFACSSPEVSQEVRTTPKNYEPILENAEVRVGGVSLEALESEGLHRHPYPRVLIPLDPGVIAVKRQDGSVEETTYRPGGARYQTNTDVHEPVNRSNHRFRAVVVELTKPPGATGPATSADAEPDPLDALVAAPQFHKLLLENERVRVLEVRNDPGDFEPMHKHSRSVLVILQGGSARFGLLDGKTREATFSAPLTFWEDAETHSVENTGDTPIHLIRVELK